MKRNMNRINEDGIVKTLERSSDSRKYRCLSLYSKPWVKRYDHRIAGLWLRRLRQAVTEKLGR